MAITVGQLLVRLGMDLSDFSKGLQDAQKEMKQQGAMFQSAGETLSKAFTLPLLALGTAATVAFAGFEQAMNKVAALGGKDVEEMFDKLTKQAMDLGKETKYSARQAADAMGELAAAGFKGNEIIAAMPGLLSLAATENMKLADAARIASSVLRGFGIDATRMLDVADILAKTAAMSSVSIQDLGYSFQYIGPAARAAGQSFMDVSAALAVLGNAGIRGESAGTALRNMFNDLMTPTKAVAEGLAALKIKTMDAYGKLLPMADLIKNLTPLTNNMAMGFKLFGQRFSDIIPLIADGGLAFRAAQEEIVKFSGAADAMAKTMQKGVAGNLEKFTGNLETLAITAGKLLAPMVNMLLDAGSKVVDFAQRIVEAFAKLPAGVQVAVLAFGTFVAAIGPVLYMIGTLLRGIGDLKMLAPVFDILGKASKTLGLDLQQTTSRFLDFIRSFSTGNISKFFTDFGKSIKDTFASIPGHLNSAKTALVQFGATLGTAVANNAKAAWASIGTFTTELKRMATALKDINISQALGSITSALSNFSFKGKGAGLWDDMAIGASKFQDLISGGFTAALGAAGQGVGLLTSELAIGAAAFTGIAAAAAAAATVITRDWEDIKNVFHGLAKDIDEDAQGMKQTLVGLWVTLSGGTFIGTIITAWKYVGGFFKDLWSGIVLTFNTAIQTLANAAAGLADKMGFAHSAKALRDYGTDVEVLANRMKAVQHISLPGVSGEALNQVKQLNDLVAKYTSEVRIGTIAQKEGAAQANAVGQQIATLYKTYQRVQQDFKLGLITPEAFEKTKAAIKQAIDGGAAFAGQMKTSFGSAGIDVNQFGKKAKKTLSDFEKDMKMVEKSADTLLDFIEDLPKSFEEFEKLMGKGNGLESTFKKIGEMWRDIGRVIAKETNPIIISKLKEQQSALMDAKTTLEMYQKQWQSEQWIKDAEKLSEHFQDIQAKAAQVNLNKSFKLESMKPTLDFLHVMQQDLDKVSDAAKLLGVHLDHSAIASKGQFTDTALNATSAINAYNLLAKTAGVTAEQMKQAWLGMERAKLAASQDAFNKLSIQADGLNKIISAAWKIGAQEFGISLLEGLKKAQAIMGEASSNLVSSLFTFDPSKMGAAVKDFGRKVLDALKAAFIEPFEKLFATVISNISMQITKLVTEKITGLLLKGFERVFNVATSAATSAAPLAAAATQLSAAATQLQVAATQLAVTNGGAKVAGEAASVAADNAAKSAGEVAKSAGSVASTAASTLSKVASISGIVTGAISAVTGVLSYLQGRRMEQDIGRIEVSTRGILAELTNLRADEWKRESHLFRLDSMAEAINRFGDAHGAYLSDILANLQVIGDLLRNGLTVNGSGTDSTGPSSTLVDFDQHGASAVARLQELADQTHLASYFLDEMNAQAPATSMAAVSVTDGFNNVSASTAVLALEQTKTAEATRGLATNAQAMADELGATSAEYQKWKDSLISEEAKAANTQAKNREDAEKRMLRSTDRWGNTLDEFGNQVRYSSQYLADGARSLAGTVSETNGAFMRLADGAILGSEIMASAANTLATSIGQFSAGIGATPESGFRLGSATPAVAPAASVNTGNVDWSNPGITMGGKDIPWRTQSTVVLQVSVNNADAQDVANTMVSTMRGRGVDI